jgi:uncharacterized membrane protein YphA (DoxX/SURF4 family)
VGKLANWELAYVAARIGVGIWLLLRFAPMIVHWSNTGWNFGGMGWDFGTVSLLLQLLFGLVAGVCLLFGFKTRAAAFIATVLCLTMASPGMAAVGVGLIGFCAYNRFGLDGRQDEVEIGDRPAPVIQPE